MTVTEWLLDSDPALRWQVMRDLLDAPDEIVTRERSRVATEGWGRDLLVRQDPITGLWDGGVYDPADGRDRDAPGQPWTGTHHTLALLRELGPDPAGVETREAIARVRENVTWDHAGQPYFDGEVEPCVNGLVVAIGDSFGENTMHGIVDRLLTEQLSDGGWNCDVELGSTRSSFHTTICVLEGLLQHERSAGASAEVAASRHRAEEYLLERRMLRRLSTGQLADRRGRFSRSRTGGTSTCCAASTIFGPPGAHPTRAWTRRSTCSRASGVLTAGGCSRPCTRERRISRWNGWGSQAAGSR